MICHEREWSMWLSLRVQTLLSSVEFLCLFFEEWFLYLVLKSFSVRPKYVSSRSSYNSSSNICLREKFLIIYRPDLSSLNKRNELVSSCRHRKKALLCNN